VTAKKLVTDAMADEAIANIELSRRHALNPRPRVSTAGKVARPAQGEFFLQKIFGRS
jgi:hypothetical protein